LIIFYVYEKNSVIFILKKKKEEIIYMIVDIEINENSQIK